MGISKKKRQFIKKNYPKKSVDELAAATGIHIRDIEKVLDIHREKEGGQLPHVLTSALEWGIPAAVFLSPFVMIPSIRDASNLAQNAFVQVVVSALFFLWAAKGYLDKKLDIIVSPILWPMIAFLIWCGVSFFPADNWYDGIPLFLQILSMGLFLLLVLNCYSRFEASWKPVYALVAAGVGIAVLGIVQYLFEFTMIPQARPPSATFTNRNMASQFMVLVFPFCLYLFMNAKGRKSAWLSAFTAGLVLVYVVYIKSLAGWIAVGVEVLVLVPAVIFVFRDDIRGGLGHTKAVPLAVGAAAFLVLINIDSGGLNFKFGGVSEQLASVRDFVEPDEQQGRTEQAGTAKTGTVKNGTAKTGTAKTGTAKTGVSTIEWRWSIWLNSLAILRDNPLTGVGAGNYRLEYPLYNHAVLKDRKFSIDAQPVHAHNDYVQAGAEFGIIGLGIILWAVCCFYYILFQLVKRELPKQQLLLICAVFSAGTGILLNAGFSFPFQRAIPPLVTALMAGLCAALLARQKQVRPFSISDPKLLAAVCIGALVLAGFQCRFHYTAIQFDKSYGRVIHAYNRADWNGLLKEGRKALEYSEKRSDLLNFYMGYAYQQLGRFEQSIPRYEKQLELFPNYLNAMINLGILYGSGDMPEKAAEMFKRVTRILPDNPKYFNDAGHYLQKAGFPNQAYGYLERAVELDPENPVMLLNFGICALGLKKFDEARSAFQKTIALKPGWEKPVQLLSVVEQQTK